MIRHWQSEKKTVIVAEHRLYYLVPYADRILYMTHGSITQEFTKAEFQKLLPDELLMQLHTLSLEAAKLNLQLEICRDNNSSTLVNDKI